MTAESHKAAMEFRLEPPSLYDPGEVVTTDPWPLPPVKPWEPAPLGLWDRMARLWGSFWGMWL